MISTFSVRELFHNRCETAPCFYSTSKIPKRFSKIELCKHLHCGKMGVRTTENKTLIFDWKERT